MARILLKFLAVLCAVAGSVTYTEGREIYNINRGWRFFPGSEVSSENALQVNLPHTWNHDALNGRRNYTRGMGNYLKEIRIPNEWRGKRVFVKCYGANSICSVLLNGRHVGEHRGGYTAFCYEITDYIQFGRLNFFWLMVNNSPQTDVLPTAGDQNNYGGIFRDMELIVTGRDIISPIDHASDGVYVIQKRVGRDFVEAEASLRISGVRDNNVTAVVTVYDDEMQPVAQESARVRLQGRTISEVTVPFSVSEPRLWDGTYDPYQYSVGVKIIADGTVSDSVGVKTGFRYFSVSPEGPFMLNGRPYPVRGVNVTQDRAMNGPALTRYNIEEDIALIRDMGANAVRVMGLTHHPEFYRLCDIYGILVCTDLPLTGPAYRTDKAFFNTDSFRRNGMAQGEEILRQHYNNPSIVMWGVFSNIGTGGDNPVDFISGLNLMLKREDPSRLTVASSNHDGEINFITDIIIWDHHFGWKEGMPSDIQIWKRQLQLNWDNIGSAVSYSAGASIHHQSDSLNRPDHNGQWHPERWQTYLHEQYYRFLHNDRFFWGTFVGNMFDYGAAGRTWGDGTGVNDCGLVTFDRKYCKDAYYMYKANWNQQDALLFLAEKRWDRRRNPTQKIKAYTNRGEAELIVNGATAGTARAANGMVIWDDVKLEPGRNFIEVRNGDLYDSAFIEVMADSPLSRYL